MYSIIASVVVSALVAVGVWYQHINVFSDLQTSVAALSSQAKEPLFGLSTFDETQGGTGTSTVSSNYIGDCLSVTDDSPLTYSWATCAAAGGGDPFPFTVSNPNGQAGVSTSTLVRFFAGASTTAFSANTLAVGGTGTTSITSGGVVVATSGTVSDPAIVVGGVAGGPGIYLNGAGILGLSDGTAGISWNGTAIYPNTDDARSLGINSTNDWFRLNALYASTTAINIGADFVSDLDGAGLTLSATGALDVNDVTAAMLNAEDFGEFTCSGTACTIDDNIIESEHFGDDDWGEGTIASNVFTIDDNVIESEHFGDDDWGEITIATNVATVDDNVIESEHLGDDDWGDITITTNAAAVEDDSHAHTATTITGANLTATDTSITFSGTYNGSTARTIGVNLGHAFVWTSTHDFGGATSVEMVNGSGPTVDAIGEFALDTTENELLVATSTNAGAPAVIKPYEWKGFSHSSSTHGAGSTTKPFFIAPPSGAGYFDSITCSATSSTANLAFLRVLLFDEAGNRMNDLVASTTEGTVKFTTNNGFTASEVINAQVGTTTNIGVFAGVTCYTKIIWTRN